ncbi:hypothetical protein ACQJBY_053916 [Aegilops geniculata]
MMKDKYEAELKTRENQIADLQKNLKSQQAESSKAKEELASALSVMEQLKEGFNKERSDWATKKAALAKRAENVGAALKPVVDELTSVKWQVHAMTAAIFGTHIGHLGSDVRKKLKAAYTLIEQLYTGAQRIISTASHNNPTPTLIQDTLKRLTMLTARVEELKKFAARTGAISALIRAKAWVPDFDPVEAAQGYPHLKEDGSEFSEEDLRAINREVRPLACQLVEEADLSHYQAQYDNQNKRVAAPTPEAENLIPPIRKHTYAPDIELSLLINDEAVFQALMGIDWTTVDFQPLGREAEVEAARDDPQPSGQAGDQA